MPPGNPLHVFPGFPTTFPLGAEGLSPPQQQAEEAFLAAVQGNILKGHGRNHLRLVFFQFNRPERAAPFLQQAARGWVNGAAGQQTQIKHHYQAWTDRLKLARESASFSDEEKATFRERIRQDDEQVFCGLMLTRAGLTRLGSGLKDPAFDAGIRKGVHPVADDEMRGAPYHREGTPDDFHGVFLLACNDRPALETAACRLTAFCHDYGVQELPATEREEGLAWRDESDPYGTGYLPPREPFGFADGISQPHFFAHLRPPAPMRTGQPTAHTWTDLRLEDVFITEGPHAGGTFAVLLKIEQKVAAFRAHEQAIAELLAQRHGLSPRVAAYLAPAVLMGRTRQGYPLSEILSSLAPTEQGLRALFPPGPMPAPGRPPQPPPWLNEFDFKAHPPAVAATPRGCPFHVHLRKMNPRRSEPDHVTVEDIITAQPIRRGATYDPAGLLADCERRIRQNQPPEWPDAGVGLLFLAYARHLGIQFEMLHSTWAPDATFPNQKPPSGQDPVLAPEASGLQFGGLPLPAMPPVLKRLGGVYLYVPSIPWLLRGGRD